ncbi:golgin subfamily A member 6-like protein 22 isoform X2 [Eutrema salsugineum]|nr:golgin subfamily A member 6-like protein 22 isoform X2 [Eutrema salsugineum]
MMRLNTLSNIDDENLSGGFGSVEVTSIISRDCQDGVVLVVVCGYSTQKETLEMMKNFIQVFFLAPQEAEGYVVLIDILQFDDQTIVSASNNVVEERVSEKEVARKEVADCLLRAFEQKDGLEDLSKISDASAAIQKCQDQHPSCDPSPEIKADDKTENGNNHEDQAVTEGTGVCVKVLPPHATIESVQNAFKEFGAIRGNGIQVVFNRLGYKIGFMEFEEANAARKAIEASPVIVLGREVLVMPKKRRFYDFWEWRKLKEEESRRQGEEGGTLVDHSWDVEQVMEEYRKFQEEQRKLEEEQSKHQEEERGTRVDHSWNYETKVKDFWDWQRSKEEQSKLQEIERGTGVYHARNHEQVLKTQRKLWEEKMTIHEKKEEFQEEKTKFQEEKMKLQEERMKLKLQEEKMKFQEEKIKLQEERTKLQEERIQEEKIKLQEERTKLQEEKIKLQEERIQEEKIKLQEEKIKLQEKRIQEEKMKLQEEMMKFQEEKMTIHEKKVEFQEEKTKFQEEKMKLQEEKIKLKLQEEKIKLHEKRIQEEKMKLQEEMMKFQEEEENHNWTCLVM